MGWPLVISVKVSPFGDAGILTPGVRIPASPKGETLTGGWEGTTSGLFEYDLVNRKRKFYTIKTKYNKHREDNVGIGGNDIFYIPRLNPNKDVPWTFPINRDDLPEINDVEVIGSIIMPRYEFKIQNTNTEDPTAYYYNRILNIINQNSLDTSDVASLLSSDKNSNNKSGNSPTSSNTNANNKSSTYSAYFC